MTTRSVFLFAIFAGLFVSQELSAGNSPVESAVLNSVGFGGKIKVGLWSPLTVTVTTTEACELELQIQATDPDGNQAIWTDRFEIANAGEHALSALFQAGRLVPGLQCRVAVVEEHGNPGDPIPVTADEDASYPKSALKQDAVFLGVLGNPGGLPTDEDSAASRKNVRGLPENLEITRFAETSAWTITSEKSKQAAFRNARAMESLNTILVSGQYDMTEVESDALRNWVILGGHLVVSVGEDAEAYQNSPLSAWLSGTDPTETIAPVKIVGITSFRRLSSLEAYAGQNVEPIPVDFQNPIQGVKFELGPETRTLAPSLNGPLIARAPYGLGTVTIMGLSLDRDPIQSWPSLDAVLSKLLILSQTADDREAVKNNKQLAFSGVSEFATQLHTGLQLFPTVKRYSTWMVIGFLVAYLLVIGPLDYVLVHHILRRPGLTWVTFPIWILGAVFLAVSLAKSSNGDRLLTNQIDVLDYDASTKTLRARSWVGIYSPETRRYEVELTPKPITESMADSPELRLSWLGTPESSLGGMYRTGGTQMFPASYRLGPKANQVANFPVTIWGSKSLYADWVAEGTAWVESDLVSPGIGRLEGTIRHNFPVPLKDWFIAYGTNVFRPKELPGTGETTPLSPGQQWPDDPSWRWVNQRELSGFLTRTVARQITVKGTLKERQNLTKMERQPYEPLAEGNPEPYHDILRILTFHEEVGGQEYTGLENHALREMDFSGRLDLGRAVLFGRLDLPVTDVQIAGESPETQRHETFIRIVLPIGKKIENEDD